MKAIALILAAALFGSTAASADENSATLVSADRSSRLIAVDGERVKPKSVGRYAVEPGNRELRFQLMIPSAMAPGKSFSNNATPTNHYFTTKVDLKAGTSYMVHVDKVDLEPKVVIREQTSGFKPTLASK